MNNSYWISSWIENKKEYPKLVEDRTEEIVIIGGGLTGLTTAYYLTKAGKKVVLLEKNKICSHTSGNTTAKITSQHGLFYSYLLQSVGRIEAKQYLEANEMAIKNIAKIIEEEKIECDFEWQDAYVFTQSKQDVEKIKKEVQALEYLDFPCEFVENIEIPIKEKQKEESKDHINIQKKVLGAIKFKNQAQFNPCLYAQGLANKIEERGGQIFENSKVIDVKKEADYYEVITEDAKIKAKKVVIASHYPIISAPGFYFMKMYQVTSYLIATEVNEPLFEGMYINSENPTISLRTAKYKDKRLLLVGGMDHKIGAKIDLKDSYKKLEEVAKQLYPDAKVLYRWNTEDCISLDKIPYIGEFSNMWPNVYVGTISLGANYMHTIKTMLEAEKHDGPSMLIAYAPCIAHGIKTGMKDSITEEKIATASGYFPLFRYNPETKKFTLDSGADFTKLDDIFKRENRYRSNQELLDKNKQDIIDNYNSLKELS